MVAGSISIVLLTLACLCICRASSANDGTFSKEKRPARSERAGMTPLKTTDEDEVERLGMSNIEAGDDPEPDAGELSVIYDLESHGESNVDGMLPLAGISTTSELLDELAEFGCELQDEVILSVSLIEVTYTDRGGKEKMVGPRTPLDEVLAAGEVTVATKGSPKPPNRVINAARQVAVKVAPRAVNGRSSR